MWRETEKHKDGVRIIDAGARTVYANERMGEILGAAPSEVMGQPSFDFVFPENASAAQHLFASKMRGNADRFRFKLHRKDSSAVWVDVQETPMYNAAGEFAGIVGTFTAVG